MPIPAFYTVMLPLLQSCNEDADILSESLPKKFMRLNESTTTILKQKFNSADVCIRVVSIAIDSTDTHPGFVHQG